MPSNAFMTVIQHHAGGEACQKLTEGMQECVEAVQKSGKPATMVLKVKFLPAGRGGAFIIAADVDTKLPAPEKQTSIWFADDAFRLHREDPHQHQLPLRTVEQTPTAAPQEVRKVS